MPKIRLRPRCCIDSTKGCWIIHLRLRHHTYSVIHAEKPACEKYSYTSTLPSSACRSSSPQATVMTRTSSLTRALPDQLSENTTHAINAQSVKLIITGKNVWCILTWCTFLSSKIATGSICGSGTQALLQDFIKSLMLQPSLTSCSLACCTAEDRYEVSAAACSFET